MALLKYWYSADGGNNWKTITKNAPNNGSYDWNTTVLMMVHLQNF